MHFVLDQNFPFQATGLPWPRSVKVSALQRRGDVDGFITNDSSLLYLPREMVMLSHTRLTLVVTDALGHDPLGATGLLMLHLPQIAKQSHPVPRIYILKRPGLHLTRLRAHIDILAAREGIPGNALMNRELAEIARIP